MIIEKLKKLGLTDKEITIYVLIVESGKISVQQLSKLSSINRTTIYSVLKELVNKGLIIEDISSSTKYYSPEDIDQLQEIYKKEEREIFAKKNNINSLIRELNTLPKSKNYSVPKVRFIEEAQINDFLHKNLLKWVESGKGKKDNSTWWGIHDATLLEEYSDWVEYHWKVLPEHAEMKVFINNKKSEKEAIKKKRERREVKLWPGGESFTATYAIMGDYIIFIMTNQHPHYLIETHDVVLAENLRNMYKTMWDKLN